MRVFAKLMTFLRLHPKTGFLLIEAYIYLGWARILKNIPFSKVASTLGNHMGETTYHPIQSNTQILKNISNAIKIMSKYTLWESQCLVKAIAGMKMLEKRGIDSTLYLGTARDEVGKLIAHAWLRSGSIYISGSEGMEKFTVVSKFAKNISNQSVERESYE